MRPIIVKFGGSNLKSKEDVRRILQTIRNYRRPVIIVVSAFYGITQYLLEAMDEVTGASPSLTSSQRGGTGRSAGDITHSIEALKKETLESILDDPAQVQAILEKIGIRLEDLRRYLMGIHYIGEIPPFVKDKILSYGERLSSLLLTEILRAQGIEAREALPEEIGLYTDGEHENAAVDFSAAEEPVRAALSADITTVIPGFYGISRTGRATLLGRGGSDYSAAALARCLGAESLDIWKDVPGYLSADPALVENPRRIETLSYTEAAELSYFGARILHPRTVEPLLDRAIPIRLFSIQADGQEIRPLSVIHNSRVVHQETVKSVTFSDSFAILKLVGPAVGMKAGILARVTSQLDRENINIKSVVTSQTVINLYLEEADLDEAYRAVHAMGLRTLADIVPVRHLSVVAMVGEGVMENPALMDRVLAALNREAIPVQIISLGASEVAAYLVMEKGFRPRAVQAIHREIFEPESRPKGEKP